jgi:hypothetical protein
MTGPAGRPRRRVLWAKTVMSSIRPARPQYPQLQKPLTPLCAMAKFTVR